MYEDAILDNPTYDFDDALEHPLAQFPIEFEAVFGIGDEFVPDHMEADDWEEYNRLYQLADRLANAALSLVRPSKLPDGHLSKPAEMEREAEAEEQTVEELLRRVQEIIPDIPRWKVRRQFGTPDFGDARAKHAFFKTCMQIHAVRRELSTPKEMADRMMILLGHLVRVKGEATRMYLARLSKCYIRDMRAEFAIMARAVLSKALSDVLPEEKAKELVGRQGKYIPLEGWIAAAARVGILEGDTLRDAHKIREEGNKAIHEYPSLESPPEELLPIIVKVLQRLGSYH